MPRATRTLETTTLGPSFESSNEHKQSHHAVVNLRQEAMITLTPFAIKQFMQAHYMNLVPPAKERVLRVSEELSYLMARMSYMAAFEIEDSYTTMFKRNDVELLVDLLTIKIKHCETQRQAELTEIAEAESKGKSIIMQKDHFNVFNQDTYVNMKLLLLDLRQWLSVEVISLGELSLEN